MGTFAPNYKLALQLEGHEANISALKFNATGHWLASADAKDTVIIWSIPDGVQLGTFSGEFYGINDIALSPDSQKLVSAGNDNLLRVWDVSSGDQPQVLKGHKGFVMCCNFHPTKNWIVSGDQNDAIHLWDFAWGNCFYSLRRHTSPVCSVEFNRAGTLMLSSSWDGRCLIWDMNSGTVIKEFVVDEFRTPLGFASFAPNEKYVLIGAQNSTWSIVDTDTKTTKLIGGFKNQQSNIVGGFIGKWLVSGSEDNKIYLWNAENTELVQTLPGHLGFVKSIACHPNQEMIASAAGENDYVIRVWTSSD